MSKEGTPSADDKSKYEAARKELVQALTKKRQVDKALAQLEVQLYNFEGTYLTETTAHGGGNVIQGFDAYLKNQIGARRRYEVNDADRMFSNSSLTYQKSLELIGDGDESPPDDPILSATNAGPKPGLTTVVLPPASRSQELTAAQNKKNRDKEYQRRKRASASARNGSHVSGEDESDISYSRKPTKRARLDDD